MLQIIREIGIFMIIAQAVVHFAPGRQYEKYIKSISGVIILLLFLRPFVQTAGGQWRSPEAVVKRWRNSAGMPEFSVDRSAVLAGGAESAVVRHMEEAIKERLNRELAADSRRVKRVELTLQEGAQRSGEEAFFSVKVVMEEQQEDGGEITVEKITVNGPQAKEEAPDAYRQRIAEILELSEERVEVSRDG